MNMFSWWGEKCAAHVGRFEYVLTSSQSNTAAWSDRSTDPCTVSVGCLELCGKFSNNIKYSTSGRLNILTCVPSVNHFK